MSVRPYEPLTKIKKKRKKKLKDILKPTEVPFPLKKVISNDI